MFRDRVNTISLYRLRSFGLLLLLLLLAGPVAARTYYVAPDGNDTWSGGLQRPNAARTDGPFASVAAARDAIRAARRAGTLHEPVLVLIAAGRYELLKAIEFGPDDGGTPTSPVVYRAQGEAVLSGAVRVEGFSMRNGAWVADLSRLLPDGKGFEQLYVAGTRAVRARTPNSGFFAPAQVTETVLEQGDGRTAKRAEQLVFVRPADAAWLQALTPEEARNVVLTFYHKWDNTRKYITSFNPTDPSVLIKGQGMKPWNPINARSQYFAENFRAALDTAGEWFYDPKARELTYLPRAGEVPGKTEVFVPRLQQLLIVRGKAGVPVTHLSFEGLCFEGSGYVLPPAGQEPVQAAAPIEAALMLDAAEDIAFRNCTVRNTGNSGIWFRGDCRRGLVEQCYLYDLGAGGVKIGPLTAPVDTSTLTTHITVHNSIIRSAGHVFPCAAGIAIFNAADNAITHNDIGDLRYTGISVGWVWGYKPSVAVRNRIEYNRVHHIGWGELSDMGGIYTLGPSPGTVVRHNVVHHVYSYTYGGWGIYTDEGSTGILIENNLVYRTKNAGFHQHYGRENIVRNNIFALGTEAQLQMSRTEEHPSFLMTRNVVYHTQGELFKSNPKNHFLNAVFTIDSNCYWNAAGKPPVYPGTGDAWTQKGHDRHSISADPRFVDAAAYDFRVRNTKALGRIGFKPFDPGKAGVYGDRNWTDRTRMPAALLDAFERIMNAPKPDYTE